MVHELGHFIAAKCMGVKVNEFAIGMGPKLFKFGKKETQYSLRLFPIGGYCAMEGEDSAGRRRGQAESGRRFFRRTRGVGQSAETGSARL